MKIKDLQLKKVAFAIITGLLLSATGMKMYAQSFTVGDIRYTVNGDGVSVTVIGPAQGVSDSVSFVIPETVTYDGPSYSVTVIGGSAFSGCSGLTSIEIPNSVVSIGGFAFSGCGGLTSIEIPNSVTTIGSYAFMSCRGLTSIEIPNSVTTIGNSAFSGCSGLTSIEIPNSVTTISTYAFGGCSGLEQITVASGNMAYDSRGNCNAIIETSTNTLLVGCKNTIIPNSVTSIQDGAFSGCSGLTSIEIPNSVTIIGNYAFNECGGLASVTIGNSVTSIGSYAFYSCSSIISVVIGNSVTSIGSYAFCGCTGLGFMSVLPETPPTLIDWNVFWYVSQSIPVYVPCGAVEEYQTASGWGVFSNIAGMCEGEVAVTVNTYEGGTASGAGYYNGGDICVLTATPNPGFSFGNWTENGLVVSVDSVFSFYAHPTTMMANFCSNAPIAFSDANVKALCVANWDTNNDGELSYAEAAKVTSLGSVFRNQGNITSFEELQFFIRLTRIAPYAFSQCYSLTSVELPNSVIRIGSCAFEYCSGLTGNLTIPNSVTSIGSYAFINCYSLTSVEIPNSVISIEDYAFEYCSGLMGNLTIPNSVTSIGSYAFSYCDGLTSVEIPNSVTSIQDDAFSGCSGLTSIEIPNSVTTIGSYAFSGCSGLTSIELPNSVTTIGNSAFSYCSGLEQITVALDNTAYDSRGNCNAIIETSTNTLLVGCKNTIIPNSVTTIGSYAFSGCSGLTSVEIPNSVTTIGSYAFSGCSGLTSIEIPNSVTSIQDGVFSGCSGLTSVEIPNSVTTIGSCAFTNCSGLTSIEIPNSVTSIGDYAFDGCNSLTSIVIPNSVTTIGDIAFLTSLIVLAETPPVVGELFCITTLYVPCGSVEAYQSAEGWNSISNIIGMCSPYTISVVANPESGGTVLGGGIYDGGVACSVAAVANEGYTFMYWTENGNQVSTNPTYFFNVCRDRELVAHFILPLTITATVNPNEGGAVIGSGVFDYGATCTLTAIPNDGYLFLNWRKNGVVVSCNASYSFTVIENAEIEAVFMLLDGTLIGVGEEINVYLPGYSCYKYALSQQIYTTSEIEEAGNIGTISYFNAGETINRYYNIYMVHTDKSSFESNMDWITVSDADLVFSGNVNMVKDYWTTITLDTPFAYNGTSNIAIIVDDNSGNYTWSPMACRVLNTDSCQAIQVYSDGTNYDPFDPLGYTGTLHAVKNQIIIGKPKYTVATVSVPLAGGEISGAGIYHEGDVCTLIATPNTGYHFLTWTENDSVVSYNSEYTFTVSENRNLVANFVAYHWNTTGNSQNSMFVVGIVMIDGIEQTSPVLELGAFCNGECRGTEFPINADGHLLYFMSIGGNSDENITFRLYDHALQQELNLYCFNMLPIEVYGFIGIDEPYEVLFASSITVSAMVNPEDAGTVTGAGEYAPGTNVTLTAIVNEGYLFDNWTINGEIVSTEPSYSFIVTGPVSLVANFKVGHSISIIVNPENAGTVIGGGEYASGSVVTLTATANEGYLFDNWTINGEIVSTELSYSFIVTESVSLVANFEVSHSVTIIVNPENAGTVLGAGEYPLGTTVTLTATANEGYAFNSWTLDGEIVSTEPSYTFTVTESMNFTANFDVMLLQQLSAGWNWFSTYLEITLDDLKAALLAAFPNVGANALVIKSKSGQTSWNPLAQRWVGSLNTIDLSQMYMIKVPTDTVITLQGVLINPADHPVTIKNGVNWIAFPSSESMSVSNAFAGFAVNGDMVKSKANGAAAYYGTIWAGALKNLVPGQGYIYKSNVQDDRTFTFPISTR